MGGGGGGRGPYRSSSLQHLHNYYLLVFAGTPCLVINLKEGFIK